MCIRDRGAGVLRLSPLNGEDEGGSILVGAQPFQRGPVRQFVDVVCFRIAAIQVGDGDDLRAGLLAAEAKGVARNHGQADLGQAFALSLIHIYTSGVQISDSSSVFFSPSRNISFFQMFM